MADEDDDFKDALKRAKEVTGQKVQAIRTYLNRRGLGAGQVEHVLNLVSEILGTQLPVLEIRRQNLAEYRQKIDEREANRTREIMDDHQLAVAKRQREKDEIERDLDVRLERSTEFFVIWEQNCLFTAWATGVSKREAINCVMADLDLMDMPTHLKLVVEINEAKDFDAVPKEEPVDD